MCPEVTYKIDYVYPIGFDHLFMYAYLAKNKQYNIKLVTINR